MKREELVDRLIRLIDRDKITQEEAASILKLFDAGKLKSKDLALVMSLSVPTAITAARALDLARSSIAGRVLVERISRDGLRKLTIRVVDEYTDEAFKIVRSFSNNAFSVRRMHELLLKEIEADMLRQATLGVRRELLPSEIRQIRDRLLTQSAYLQRFMDEVAALRLAGREMSEKQILQRARRYAGQSLGVFWQFSEKEYNLGDKTETVHDYIAVDDEWTCQPCIDSQSRGPYLPEEGPMPGIICLGAERCRCERVPRHDPEKARELLSQR